MRKLMQILLSTTVLVLGLGCEKQNYQECVKGEVIGYEYCTNAVLVQLSSDYDLGSEMVYYDETTYNNVVRAPGELGEYGQGDLFFNYRQYNREVDYHLFKYQESPCNQHNYPFSVPTIVISNYSTSNCQLDDEE